METLCVLSFRFVFFVGAASEEQREPPLRMQSASSSLDCRVLAARICFCIIIICFFFLPATQSVDVIVVAYRRKPDVSCAPHTAAPLSDGIQLAYIASVQCQHDNW